MDRLFRRNVLSDSEEDAVSARISSALSRDVGRVSVEYCFNIEKTRELSSSESEIVRWLLAETFAPDDLGSTSFFQERQVVEVGPRPTFESAWSSTCVSICQAAGVPEGALTKIERSRRYCLSCSPLSESEQTIVVEAIADRMTECAYPPPSREDVATEEVEAFSSMEAANEKGSLGFDAFDLEYYKKLFEELGRAPTDVELYDLSQSNSEHSRHWFFSGRHVIDGVEQEKTLFQLVKETLKRAKTDNSIVSFSDNSSAIKGGAAKVLCPVADGILGVRDKVLHPLLTAETHNFPSAVAPFPGAETGAGGRIRDVQATGRGAFACAGVAGYCVGAVSGENLGPNPAHLASPLDILLKASDGASDYGNKFGEPLVAGYCRSLAVVDQSGQRREWLKPVMFSAGIGWLDDRFVTKGQPEPGMKVVKVGGPAYRIGMGGGSASSRVSTAGTAALDFNAVQRGDAQMCNRMNRVIRACLEQGDHNPIVSIHDQGCGGNGNVLKEIVEPAGAKYDLGEVTLGDPTMTALEIWGAEYQESNALLVRSEDEEMLVEVARRERCGLDVVGVVTGDGNVAATHKDRLVVDLPLEKVLGKLPPKLFKSDTPQAPSTSDATSSLAFDRSLLSDVLRLPCVGSKRFLVHKVDRSVTGLVAQQQCVGPFQVPVSDYAVLSRSHFCRSGVAVAVGEAPQVLTDSKVMARRCVAEMLTNLCFVKVTSRQDIRLSANWMWAAKLEGEGALMYRACEALSEALILAEVAVDGGKDSLSMAAPDGQGNIIKSPGALALTAYATCPDLCVAVTPNLRGNAAIVLVDLSVNKGLAGTALAQARPDAKLGSVASDCDALALARAFDVVQNLLAEGDVTAGHDRSDGGLVTTLLEMCFASYCGIDVHIDSSSKQDTLVGLFDEGPGVVLETESPEKVLEAFAAASVEATVIGKSTTERVVSIRCGEEVVLDAVPVVELWSEWEETSFAFEAVQREPKHVEAERLSLAKRVPPVYEACPLLPLPSTLDDGSSRKHRVAILRCEGSNGDREMAAAFYAAGLSPVDVTVSDLVSGRSSLDEYKGIAFVGGFSYADVCDSAKGWAASIRFKLKDQFDAFKSRGDTFSLGVCNGCQLEALLGWLDHDPQLPETRRPRFVHNSSGKFESRWVSVKIVGGSPCALLDGMDGATIGVWVAHGEGRCYFPELRDAQKTLDLNLAPIRYCDDRGDISAEYPFCPNGSYEAIAGMCSPDGRHLALMPHPERAVFGYQWPYGSDRSAPYAPWMRLFQNAKQFLDGQEVK